MEYREHSSFFHRYHHIFAGGGLDKFSMVGTLFHTFQDNSDDPPLLLGSRAVVDTLQDFRLNISVNHCKQVSCCVKKREKIPTAYPYSSTVRREYH